MNIRQKKKTAKSNENQKMPMERVSQTNEVVHEKLMGKAIKKLKYVGTLLVFPLAVFFMELVMRLSINSPVRNHYGIYICLFSVSYGLVLYILGTITKYEKVNRCVQAGLLCMIAILFCALYFMYCEFRMFYDFNTMFAGAQDAIGDFSGDIVSMVCSIDGICHIILFFLPFLLFLFFGKKIPIAKQTGLKEKGIVLGCVCLIMFWTISGIYLSDADSSVYAENYNYNTAIEDFGLLTGLRLELSHVLSGEEQEITFTAVTTMAESDAKSPYEQVSKVSGKPGKESGAKEDETIRDIPQGKNQLDIDFEKLAKEDGGAYAALDEYVASLQASSKNEYTGYFSGKNLIFMTAEAFTEEVIDPRLTPTLYRLAHKGIQFTDYYQPSSAGTTGGEYSNIFGMLPTAGGSSMKKTANHYNWSTMAFHLSEMGYYGKAYHNNDYTYYDRHKTHVNLGFSNGYEGYGNGLEDVITKQWPESDLEMMKGTLSTYIKKQPFYIYYMTVSGHSLYTFDKNAMSQKHKEQVENLSYSEPVKAYLACQLELEDALTYLVTQLERLDMADDTVIVISADHFPYGLDQDSGNFAYLEELYERPISDSLDRDHNRLIIWSGCLEKEAPIIVNTPTSSMDILPTLCNLFGVEFDARLLPGRDVFSDAEPLVFNLGYDWKTDKGTFIAGKGKFIPKNEKEEVSEAYIERMKTIVKNKIIYSREVLNQDYFRHIFDN